MVISTYPAPSTAIIASVQRGTTATSGSITISSVNPAKTLVNSFSTGAAGTVAATGALSAANGTVITVQNAGSPSPRYGGGPAGATFNTTTRNIAMNTTNLSGGSTNLTSAAFGVYLSNATTLEATGACRYEVIEYV